MVQRMVVAFVEIMIFQWDHQIDGEWMLVYVYHERMG